MMQRRHREGDDVTMETEKPSSSSLPEKRRITWVIRGTVILYALCYWLQLGIIPYLTRKLGVDAKMYGYLQSVFSFVQLCGGPLFGRFGDLVGGKYALILAYIASAASYGILAIASNIPLLFLSRLPSCAMHSMQGSQMIITDITSDEERAGGIGYLGVFYGVGMVVGPLLGGYITDKLNEQAAAFSAAIGSVLCIGLIFIFIPADTRKYGSDDDVQDTKRATGSVLDIRKYMSIFRVKNFTYLFVIKIVSGIPFGIFQAMFSICVMDYFHLGAKENGFILSYVGITAMAIQGFGVDALTRRYSDAVLIKYSIVMISVAYIFLTFVSNIYVFLLVLLPLTCGGSVFAVVVTSFITKTVPGDDTGAALGLSMSIHSLIRTVSPTIGGLLYTRFGYPVFGISGFLVNGVLTAYLFMFGRDDL